MEQTMMTDKIKYKTCTLCEDQMPDRPIYYDVGSDKCRYCVRLEVIVKKLIGAK